MLFRVPVKGDYIKRIADGTVSLIEIAWNSMYFQDYKDRFVFVDVEEIEPPVVVVKYLNIYDDGSTYLHNTKEEAHRAYAGSKKTGNNLYGVVARVRLEYVEGQND